MEVNLNKSFKDFKGKEIGVMIADEVGKILYNMGASGKMSVDEKYMAYKLCNKVCQCGEIDLSAEEAAFIIKACGEALTAGAYGQVRDLINNK